MIGIFLGGLFGILKIDLILTEIKSSDYIVQGILWFGGKNEAIDTVHNIFEFQGRRVVPVKYTVTNSALLIHVAVINQSYKSNLWSSERIIFWKLCIH